MFADEISGIKAASWPQPSPTSAFRSMARNIALFAGRTCKRPHIPDLCGGAKQSDSLRK
jgi:hypothetical protein